MNLDFKNNFPFQMSFFEGLKGAKKAPKKSNKIEFRCTEPLKVCYFMEKFTRNINLTFSEHSFLRFICP